MASKQMQKNFPRHAGRSPGRDVTGCDHAGIGKTGFFTHAAVAFKNCDGVSLAGQLIGGAHPDDARPYDGDLHGESQSWDLGVAERVYVQIIGFCWREGLVFHS